MVTLAVCVLVGFVWLHALCGDGLSLVTLALAVFVRFVWLLYSRCVVTLSLCMVTMFVWLYRIAFGYLHSLCDTEGNTCVVIITHCVM